MNCIMETKDVRKKIIVDFGKIIKDDSNVLLLEGIFDAIKNDLCTSKVPESHYLVVEEGRERYMEEPTLGISWDDFEVQLLKKYDF